MDAGSAIVGTGWGCVAGIKAAVKGKGNVVVRSGCHQAESVAMHALVTAANQEQSCM